MINLVLDSSTLKQSEISGHPPKQMALRKKLISSASCFHLVNIMHLDLMLFGENDGITIKYVSDDKLGIKWWSQMVSK